MNSKILFGMLLLTAGTISAQSSITLLEPANGATQVPLYPLLKWTQVPNAGGYQVQISTKSDFSVLYHNHGLANNSLTPLCPLVPSTQYFWRVRRYNGSETDWSSPFTFTSKDTVVNLTPTLLLPPNNSEQSNPVIFKWTKTMTGMYAIEISKDKSFPLSNKISILTGSNPSFTYVPDPLVNSLPKLEFNTTYYWRVVAVCPQGQWSDIYSFKLVEFVTPPAPAPAPPQPPVRLGSQTEPGPAYSFPNPFTNFVTVTFHLVSAGSVQFEISDAQGLKIDQFNKTFSEKGWQSVEWHSKTTRPGNYFCKIVTREKTEIVKLLLSQ